MKDLRPKPPSKIKRMQGSLKDHLTQIIRLLSDPKRDTSNAHIFLAGSLRVLLCDTEPLLIRYADHFGITLKIWGPNPPNFKPDNKIILALNFSMASDIKVEPLHEMTIQQYLQTSLGVANFNSYTPYQLIKWVANKEGGAHLDPKAHDILEDIKNTFSTQVPVPGYTATDGFMVHSTIIQISNWTMSAIEKVLAASTTRNTATGAT